VNGANPGRLADGRVRLRGGAADLWWIALVGGLGAAVLAWLLTLSVQAASGFVLIVIVVALHQYDRRYGIAAMCALWLVAPLLRRLFLLMTGTVASDPLSLAPFLATAAIAGLELAQRQVPSRIRRILLLAAAGFAIGLPLGLINGPGSALFACFAYLAGLSGAVLGANERLGDSTLRRVLLYGVPPIAAYAIAQRFLPLPSWDLAWLDSVDYVSIGRPGEDLRSFGSLNGPGALAPILALSLLCLLTVRHHTRWALASAVLLTVALSLTSVRSAWAALVVAGLAHVLASRGRSANLVLGAMAVIAATTLALAPVTSTAASVIDRFGSILNPGSDESATARQSTFTRLLPTASSAPVGHGLGSAGQATKLQGSSDLQAIDNGYLSILYQAGPIGFILVMAALAAIARAAWAGARARAPGQDLRLLLFAMLVFLLVQATSGDIFYGFTGVILWFVGGQALAYELRWRRAPIASA
jgi:O-Antigen ligase